MSIDLVHYKGHSYPKFQSSGHAARFILPFAVEICKGVGLDIGCGREEWSLPGSIPIDLKFENGFHATKLPGKSRSYDYIFSSHCLEHIPNWVEVLDYWSSMLRKDGVLFLYLPSYEQIYWRPWNNRKHVNIFNAQIIYDYMQDSGYKNIYFDERDLNHSFAIFGELGRT